MTTSSMKTTHRIFARLALGVALCLPAAAVIAAPTEAPTGGATSVQLAPSFVGALGSLGVTPGAVSPGRLVTRNKAVVASFPITTGEIDLGTVKAEIDHAGGLSLTAGSTQVELTSFIIDLTGTSPVLTGLITVNGDLVGRAPLFDLNLGSAKIASKEQRFKVTDVAVTLTDVAAGKLNSVFRINALTRGLAIGTATVRALLDHDEGVD